VGRLVEHSLPLLHMARVARDPEMPHAPAALRGLASRRANARHPADPLRHPRRYRVAEGAAFGTMLEQRYWHKMIMPGLTILSHASWASLRLRGAPRAVVG
jgi:hypothetical protein